MLQLRQRLAEVGSGLLRRELLIGHMGDEKLQELLHAVIGELAVGIAPLTVVLVEGTVGVLAGGAIVHASPGGGFYLHGAVLRSFCRDVRLGAGAGNGGGA